MIEYFQPPLNLTPGFTRNGLVKLRTQVNLRTVDTAYHLGVAESTVRNWESGRTVPKLTFAQVRRLLDLYNCSFEELASSV